MAAGDWVIAIGNPFGYRHTVTVGVISATERPFPVSDLRFSDMLQTDAAINPGNSGGPLLNIRGEVIGMNTAIISSGRQEGNIGIGFAVPINAVRDLLPQLHTGKVIRGRIGVQISAMKPGEEQEYGLKSRAGAVVGSVESGGAADKGGVKPGDVVVEYNGRPVATTSELVKMVTATKPGTTVPLKVMRSEQRRAGARADAQRHRRGTGPRGGTGTPGAQHAARRPAAGNGRRQLRAHPEQPHAAGRAPAAAADGDDGRRHHRRRSGRSVGRRAAPARRDPVGQRPGRLGRRPGGPRAGPGGGRPLRADPALARRRRGVRHRPQGVIADIVRERGPLTVAAFMDLALYHPEFGYYARAARRSGRAGDFFTSVDVGPLFGELLEAQIAEMAGLLASAPLRSASSVPLRPRQFRSRRSRRRQWATGCRRPRSRCGVRHPDLLQRVRLSLVEASPAARAAQAETLRGIFDRPFASSEALPDGIEGVVFANELLDAFPVHQVVMRDDGLKEVYVEAVEADLRRADLLGPPPRLRIREGPLSTPSLAEYLDRLHVELEPGWRAEINLRAVEWIRAVARRLRRGFVVLIDYGHEARDLYSASHSAGTLTTFTRHTSGTAAADDSVPAWLEHPGDQDITAHVDFTSVRAAAEAEGLTTIGFLDQTYFILGLIGAERQDRCWRRTPAFRERLALKTLLMPGGLGSTMKVLVFGKGVGRPALAGCSYRVRVT